MESRNKIIFRLMFSLELILILVILIQIYNQRKEIISLKKQIENINTEELAQYDTTEIDKEIEFYTNIETNIKNLYDEYYTNINLLEQKIQRNETNVKIAYLTFDDGPYGLTEKYLDVLKQHNVRGTFFVLGKDGFDATYKRIVNEGHTLANHTYYHNISTGLYNNTESFMNQVIKLEDYLYNITGHRTSIVRFPGGSPTAKGYKDDIVNKLHERGYNYVDWNCETGDGASAKLAIKGTYQWFLDTTQGKNIIVLLMHDYNTQTFNDLPRIITYLKENNYIMLPLHNKSVMVN